MLNTKLLIAHKSKGLKAYELAEQAGIENTRLCRIISGKLTPTKKEKRALSKILKIPQKNLF